VKKLAHVLNISFLYYALPPFCWGWIFKFT
jgi:hypothetical protein